MHSSMARLLVPLILAAAMPLQAGEARATHAPRFLETHQKTAELGRFTRRARQRLLHGAYAMSGR